MSNTNTDLSITRRTLLGAFTVPWLVAGCSTPLPLGQRPIADSNAAARLRDSAQAHGVAAYRQLSDINVSYEGRWRPLVGRIQPDVVDEGHRGSSQERLIPSAGVMAQAYVGPKGRKQVNWRRNNRVPNDLGDIAIWFDGVRNTDVAAQQAAALVAEGYGLFLLGPLWLADRELSMQMNGTEQVDGRTCDVIDVWMSPGIGYASTDRLAICIDRVDSLVHRMRFTLEGSANTRGAVAEVDTFEHHRRFGVVWPMRSFERVVHPISLPAHDWRMTGLDVNRGYKATDLSGPSFTGLAAAPARAL